MSTSFGLENLARIVHTDKMHNYAQECFARQVELVQQSHRPPFWLGTGVGLVQADRPGAHGPPAGLSIAESLELQSVGNYPDAH